MIGHTIFCCLLRCIHIHTHTHTNTRCALIQIHFRLFTFCRYFCFALLSSCFAFTWTQFHHVNGVHTHICTHEDAHIKKNYVYVSIKVWYCTPFLFLSFTLLHCIFLAIQQLPSRYIKNDLINVDKFLLLSVVIISTLFRYFFYHSFLFHFQY